MHRNFTIPVVLFIFKRIDTTLSIIKRLSQIAPQKIYLIADFGRNADEQNQAIECRKSVEKAINWNCMIVKNYAKNNRGVYKNIGEGAKWVLSQEPCAIFLEDDNLPELSFFKYCEELLCRYNDDTRILWICGTNYLGRYKEQNGYSYIFTQHMLPCGWATWSHKFLKYYDGNLDSLNDAEKIKKFKASYLSNALYQQQLYSINQTKYFLDTIPQKSSWDYQMLFSLRANNLYGISPCSNQIKNIGVDAFSEHGGTSMNFEMTRRLCGMESYELDFPLIHPESVKIDRCYEMLISDILLMPKWGRIKRYFAKIVKRLLGLPPYCSMQDQLKRIKLWGQKR